MSFSKKFGLMGFKSSMGKWGSLEIFEIKGLQISFDD